MTAIGEQMPPATKKAPKVDQTRELIINQFPPPEGKAVFRCVNLWGKNWRITYYDPKTYDNITSKFIKWNGPENFEVIE